MDASVSSSVVAVAVVLDLGVVGVVGVVVVVEAVVPFLEAN